MELLSSDIKFKMDTETSSVCDFSGKYIIVRVTVNTVIAAVCLIGNGLILVSIIRYKHLRKTFYFMIASLALADFLFGFVLLTYTAEKVVPFLYGVKYFCLVRQSLVLSFLSISLLTMCLITLKRFVAVVCPIKVQNHKKFINLIIINTMIIGWILLFAISFMTVLLLNRYDSVLHGQRCEPANVLPTEFTLIYGVITLTLMVLNTSLYCAIIYRLRKDASENRNNHTKTKQMVLVFSVFCSCWAPFAVLSVLSYWENYLYCVLEFTTYPAFGNSAMNWIIYGFTNTVLREAFKSLCCRV